MKIPEQISSERLAKFSGEHLYYEIGMLYDVTDTLFKDVKDMFIYNALLESFVIHASVILDFFYATQLKPDDARAVHFVKNEKKWLAARPVYNRYFKSFQKKRSKQVVHLSYHRLDVQPENKKWNSAKIVKEIRKLVDLFLDHADPKKLDKKMYALRTKN